MVFILPAALPTVLEGREAILVGRLEDRVGNRSKAEGGAVKAFVRVVKEIIQRPCHPSFHSITPREELGIIAPAVGFKVKVSYIRASSARSRIKVITWVPIHHQGQEVGPTLAPGTVDISWLKS
jgi:hypothetical protein